MKNDDKNELIETISRQIKIINEIKLHLECDLYVCFEGENQIDDLFKKKRKLQKLKEQLIKIFSSLVSEF